MTIGILETGRPPAELQAQWGTYVDMIRTMLGHDREYRSYDGVVQIWVTRETWNPLVGAALAAFGVTHKPPVLNHARRITGRAR